MLKRLGLRLHRPIVDTRDLGQLLALERGHATGPLSLSSLAHSLELPVHRPHHALGDALTTAQVFVALATHLDAYAAQTVRSLGRANQRAQSFALYPSGPEDRTGWWSASTQASDVNRAEEGHGRRRAAYGRDRRVGAPDRSPPAPTR